MSLVSIAHRLYEETDADCSNKRHSYPTVNSPDKDICNYHPRLNTMPSVRNEMRQEYSVEDLTRADSNESIGMALSEAECKYEEFLDLRNVEMARRQALRNPQQTLKSKMSKFQAYIERAFNLLNTAKQQSVIEGYNMLAKVMTKAWEEPRIGHDLAYGLCDYFRDSGYLHVVLHMFIQTKLDDSVRFAIGSALVEFLSAENRDYVVRHHFVQPLVRAAKELIASECGKSHCPVRRERLRISMSLTENLFKHSANTTFLVIELGLMDVLLNTIKKANRGTEVVRHAALALTNLAMYSDSDSDQMIIAKKIPNWLFLLASHQDPVTSYYACLAICVLFSKKAIQAVVQKSGTLRLVEPFLNSHKPMAFVQAYYELSQGKQKDWLLKVMPLLASNRKEPKSLAAFHFCMEAIVKKGQERLDVLHDIGAVGALKEVASSPNEVAAKYATKALEIIGEEVPHRLAQQVALWSVSDVTYWVTKIGFEDYSDRFTDHMVDGDLLLLITHQELETDLGIKSSILRKRFLRELKNLKMSADYNSLDETNLDSFLVSVSPELSIYTYQMLQLGIDRSVLVNLNDDTMQNHCGIRNSVHRMRLAQALQECSGKEDLDVAILSKKIDIFISYRRCKGNQLASLLKVQLQLRGYRVFLDIDRFNVSKIDVSMLKNIQAARHFVLILTENSFDPLLNDNSCQDWMHEEIRCAMQYGSNIIPVFDSKFQFPEEIRIPADIRSITRFNAVRWVHDYQEACLDKVERFLKGQAQKGDLAIAKQTSKEEPCPEIVSHALVKQETVEIAECEHGPPENQERRCAVLNRLKSAPILTTENLNAFVNVVKRSSSTLSDFNNIREECEEESD